MGNFRQKLSRNCKLTYFERLVERHAAAASIGTYLKKGDQHYHETIDILVNKITVEQNINVRNLISGSLKKIKNEPEYKSIIYRLINIDRENFIQEFPMQKSLVKANYSYEEIFAGFRNSDINKKNSDLPPDQFDLELQRKLINQERERLQKFTT